MSYIAARAIESYPKNIKETFPEISGFCTCCHISPVSVTWKFARELMMKHNNFLTNKAYQPKNKRNNLLQFSGNMLQSDSHSKHINAEEIAIRAVIYVEIAPSNICVHQALVEAKNMRIIGLDAKVANRPLIQVLRSVQKWYADHMHLLSENDIDAKFNNYHFLSEFKTNQTVYSPIYITIDLFCLIRETSRNSHNQKAIHSALLVNAVKLLEQYSANILLNKSSICRNSRHTQDAMQHIRRKIILYKAVYLHVFNFLLDALDYDKSKETDIARVGKLIPHCHRLLELDHTFLDISKLCQLWSKIGSYQLFADENPAQAVLYYEKLLKVATSQTSKSYVNVAVVKRNLGIAYGLGGDYKRKRDLVDEAHELFENQCDPDTTQLAITLHHLGAAYGELGDFEKQRELLEVSLKLNNICGADDYHFGDTLNNLGCAHRLLGNYSQQKNLQERALIIFEKHFGPEHRKTGELLVNLGNAYGLLGDYNKQKELQERAWLIFKEHLGSNNLKTIDAQDNLGSAYGMLGNYEKQRELQEYALKIKEKTYGSNHYQIGYTLINLGNAYGFLGNYKKQCEMQNRALRIYEQHFESNHPNISNVLDNLGRAYGHLSDYNQMHKLLTRALDINIKHYGHDHTETGITMYNLSEVFYKLNDKYEAAKFATDAVKIFRLNYGERHDFTIKANKMLMKSLF